jgi:hypothetical protein
VNGTTTNNGVLLKDTSESGAEIRFYPENHPTAADRPMLVIDYSAASTVVTFQNGVLPNTSYAGCEDNWMHSSAATTNYGTNDWGNGIGSYAGTKRSLIKFNVSTIPSAATVTSAKLQLKITAADASRTIEAFQVLRAWTQLGSTWNNYASGLTWTTAGCSGSGTDRASTAAGSFSVTTASPGTWVEITLPNSLVQGWVNGTITNYGLLLKATVETSGETRYAAENRTTTTDRPKLIIEYTGG